jgi:L-arabinokinase
MMASLASAPISTGAAAGGADAVATGTAVGVGSGRLDWMGGVSDYSGGLVLQVATRCATKVSAVVTVGGCAVDDDAIALASGGFGAAVQLPLACLRAVAAAKPGDTAGCAAFLSSTVRHFLESVGAPRWAYYMFGCVAAFAYETGWLPPAPPQRLHLSAQSAVPPGQGVSSSASIEVATLRALSAVSHVDLPPLRMAHLGQACENYCVGAACGLMDQLSSACGAAGAVLPITCRPDACDALVPLPPSVVVVGWPSGVIHSVAGSPYLAARTATFMGKKIAEAVLGRKLAFITDLQPWEYRSRVDARVPATLTGAAFLSEYGAVDDGLSQIASAVTYAVAAAARFPIEETFRCRAALSLLRHLASNPAAARGSALYVDTLTQIGQLMLLAHAGYSAIGLGAPETDEMVARLMALGPAQGIYGARISGGGSGGTVAVLCERDALPLVEALARDLTFGMPFTGLVS